MSLRDAACYTLTLIPSMSDPKILELVENYNGPSEGPRKQEARFARVKETREGEIYSATVHDYFSGAKLASMGMENIKGKKRRLELHGPDEDVPFEFTGMINFEWTFTFENNKYRWNRSFAHGGEYICSIDRKPDPKVEICLAREADKKDPARLQILHYNIDRFPDEIKDMRGLETLLAATFLSFLDDIDSRNARTPSPNVSAATLASDPAPTEGSTSAAGVAPPVPVKPQKVISEEDFEPENPNEILVSMTSSIDEHVSRAVWLLEDPHVLFIVIRTRAAAATQRALEVSLGITRFRHKEGLDELKQYVVEEEPVQPDPSHIKKGGSPPLGKRAPTTINLNDPPKPSAKAKPGKLLSPPPATAAGGSSSTGSGSGSSTGNSGATLRNSKSADWSAPNVAIYMSKIDLPDLAPGRRGLQKASSTASDGDNINSSSTGHALSSAQMGKTSPKSKSKKGKADEGLEKLPPPPVWAQNASAQGTNNGPSSASAGPSSGPLNQGKPPGKPKESGLGRLLKVAAGSR